MHMSLAEVSTVPLVTRMSLLEMHVMVVESITVGGLRTPTTAITQTLVAAIMIASTVILAGTETASPSRTVEITGVMCGLTKAPTTAEALSWRPKQATAAEGLIGTMEDMDTVATTGMIVAVKTCNSTTPATMRTSVASSGLLQIHARVLLRNQKTAKRAALARETSRATARVLETLWMEMDTGRAGRQAAEAITTKPMTLTNRCRVVRTRSTTTPCRRRRRLTRMTMIPRMTAGLRHRILK